MKTLIISDIHLTHVFDEKKFLFLKDLISSYDEVVLNGDFWDGYLTTFDRFLASPWSNLFPLLKNKRTVYLFGNHDQEKFNDERANLFSVEQKHTHSLHIGGKTYILEHGHRLNPAVDTKYHISMRAMYFITYFSQKIERILVRMGSPQNIVVHLANLNIIQKLKRKKESHWYVCGHTHFAEVNKKAKFANSGFVLYGKASYIVIDDSYSTPILKSEWYK